MPHQFDANYRYSTEIANKLIVCVTYICNLLLPSASRVKQFVRQSVSQRISNWTVGNRYGGIVTKKYISSYGFLNVLGTSGMKATISWYCDDGNVTCETVVLMKVHLGVNPIGKVSIGHLNPGP